MLDACDLEARGIPTITVCHEVFQHAARIHAKSRGMPDLPLLIEPTPTTGNLSRDVAALAGTATASVVAALTVPLVTSDRGAKE